MTTTNLWEWRYDDRVSTFVTATQRTNVGNFINFSLQGDQFGISIGGTLSSIPQLAQVSAIIQGVLGIFGLGQTAPEPPVQLKTITVDAGVTLATLFGASQGINFLVQVLRGKIEEIKNYVQSAITSIQNLIECVLKNPLLAAALLAKIIRQGWLTMPVGLREVLEKARDIINGTIGLNILVYNPLAKLIAFIKKLLSYKFPPPFLLPFIPYIPGCSPAFYSGRPPTTLRDTTPIVTPQTITVGGGFTSQINTPAVIPLDIGPGANPNLTLTPLELANLGAEYNPFDLYTSGTIGSTLNQDLNITNYPLRPTTTNSATRQVQDQLLSARTKVVNDITVLNKDISRAGFIPRPNPLDELLCKPGEKL